MDDKTPRLVIEFDNGETWAVPAIFIAEQRARYYEENDPGETVGETFAAEFEFTMTDSFELVDWAANNMDWKDLVAHAVKVEDPDPFDYDGEWSNAEKRYQNRPAKNATINVPIAP